MPTKLKQMNSEPTVDDLAEQLAVLRDDIRSISETMAEYGKAKTNELSDKAKEQLEQARDTARDGVDAARAQVDHLNGQANAFIQQQPATALGIAAGIGFLVGMMGSRRS